MSNLTEKGISTETLFRTKELSEQEIIELGEFLPWLHRRQIISSTQKITLSFYCKYYSQFMDIDSLLSNSKVAEDVILRITATHPLYPYRINKMVRNHVGVAQMYFDNLLPVKPAGRFPESLILGSIKLWFRRHFNRQ